MAFNPNDLSQIFDDEDFPPSAEENNPVPEVELGDVLLTPHHTMEEVD